MRDRLQQELCQADFGRKRVTKLQSRLTFCHGRLFFSHFCCMDRKNVLHLHSERPEDGHTVDVAQLVRASDCGSEGRGFEPLLPPEEVSSKRGDLFFCAGTCICRRGSLNARCTRHLPPRQVPAPPQQEAADSHIAQPPPQPTREDAPLPFSSPLRFSAAAHGRPLFACRQLNSPASARQRPNLPTHAAIDSKAARRFSLPPPTDEPSARRQTSLRPTDRQAHHRSADSKAIRRAPLHSPPRRNRPIFRNRHYPHKRLNLRNRHRPRPSASIRHKKTAVPALGTAVVSMLEPA